MQRIFKCSNIQNTILTHNTELNICFIELIHTLSYTGVVHF